MQIQSEPRSIVLSAVAETSESAPNERFRLFAQATLPVFSAPELLGVKEGVAVVYRDAQGKPFHGGFYSVTNKGEIVKLVFVDEANGINTDADPAWTAFGLCASLGHLRILDEGVTKRLPWSIIDLYENRPDEELHAPDTVRLRIRDAYRARVAPLVRSSR